MTDPCKNNAFAGSEPGDSGGFSANQSKPWRHGEHSYLRLLHMHLHLTFPTRYTQYIHVASSYSLWVAGVSLCFGAALAWPFSILSSCLCALLSILKFLSGFLRLLIVFPMFTKLRLYQEVRMSMLIIANNTKLHNRSFTWWLWTPYFQGYFRWLLAVSSVANSNLGIFCWFLAVSFGANSNLGFIRIIILIRYEAPWSLANFNYQTVISSWVQGDTLYHLFF